MSFWDVSFFNYSVPDLNEEPLVEYSYGTIDLNAEPNADVGFDSQASYRFMYDDSKQSNPEELILFITEMDVEMPHQEDVTQQGPPLDPETLALSQHAWLLFEPQSAAAAARCRRILRMSTGTPRCIDWGVLIDCGEAVRARAILGENTPVREEDDEELPPDIEFYLGGEHFEMLIERFAVHLGIYYEPETVRDDFVHGLTQGEEGVMRVWWAQISDTPFTGHRVRATMIRDPLIR
ncbi:hypothetical protein R6Q57_013019 [Mikania cordata]